MTSARGILLRSASTIIGILLFSAILHSQEAAYKDTDCVKCHANAVKEMTAAGGKHKDVGCTTCHGGHPPAVKQPYPKCGDCHEPHSKEPAAADCGQCHHAHTPAQTRFDARVPAKACGACHAKALSELAATKTRHGTLSCGVCHRETHKATRDCKSCHGRPHPAAIMARFSGCAECHHTAHDLNHWPETK
jgi:hypothetical protein